MEAKEIVLKAMREFGEPVNAGKIAEITGLDRKVVDKAFDALKKEGAIVNSVTTTSSQVFEGYYWSATGEPVTAGIASTPYAHALKFTKAAITYPFSETRDRGMCVRLVWDAN